MFRLKINPVCHFEFKFLFGFVQNINGKEFYSGVLVYPKGEDPVILKAGSYAYGPAGKPHKAKCLDNGPCVLFVAMVDPFDAKPITKKE